VNEGSSSEASRVLASAPFAPSRDDLPPAAVDDMGHEALSWLHLATKERFFGRNGTVYVWTRLISPQMCVNIGL
jgi:hypothetical protein